MNENKTKDSKGFAALMRLIRPKQWIKNMFIFVPLFFGGALFHTDALLAGLITFIAYSFAASSIYCFNDIYDVEADRRHPVKCHRPIASGAVSVKQAYGLMHQSVCLFHAHRSRCYRTMAFHGMAAVCLHIIDVVEAIDARCCKAVGYEGYQACQQGIGME